MPLYRKTFLENGGILTLWEIQETEEELLSEIFLSDDENEELATIKSSKSRLRWLASRLALRNLFDSTQIVDVKKDQYGKPYLSMFSGHISISHSGNMAAAVFHPERSAGVDIELIRPKIVNIATKFLSSKELQSIDKNNELKALFACWCVKEAVYKWHGRKGLSLKDGIEIQPFVYDEVGVFEAVVNTPERNIFCIHYENIGEYMLAYVCY